MLDLMKFLNKVNWPKTTAILFALVLFSWAVGCTPTVQSLTTPGKKVSAAQLQSELDMLIAQFEVRKTSLEEQNKLRQLLLQNALLITSTGTVNPIGILTGLLAFYGVGSGINDTKKAIKKIKSKPLT